MFRKLIILSGLIAATTISLAIKPDKKYIRLPQNEGLIYKELPVLTEDGYKIKTWFFPAQDMHEKSKIGENASLQNTLRGEQTDDCYLQWRCRQYVLSANIFG